jgi:hypothetical protein
MQKNYLAMAAAALLTASSLGGCATSPTTGLPVIDPTVLASVEAQVQQDVAAACAFVPTLASVAGVIASFVSAGAVINLVDQATTSICSAILAAPTAPVTPAVTATGRRTGPRRLAAPVIVNGVQIHGYFLK